MRIGKWVVVIMLNLGKGLMRRLGQGFIVGLIIGFMYVFVSRPCAHFVALTFLC